MAPLLTSAAAAARVMLVDGALLCVGCSGCLVTACGAVRGLLERLGSGGSEKRAELSGVWRRRALVAAGSLEQRI